MTWTPEQRPGEQPQQTADRILDGARKLIQWARAFVETRDALPICECGKQIHTTHLGAAQHALWLMITGGDDGTHPVAVGKRQPGQFPSLKYRIYQCRQNSRALHVGR